ncbi:tRNA (adenosine(37)-N6)-threonylcarbamoyltransferase complex dimerization subunit type 1 TsaB [Propionibacteriaceae bacterium G57]|uniref:tRNA (adenosine(37)-N6)-threonylcarbamoyltransferase complex dimerization subunit type 1 TsaB n=1 Tax=Aestuariimicrobium sp. G57 TaxID=3418485 RepID=UPI003DA77B14
MAEPRWTLAIDTSTTVCAAIALDGQLVAEAHVDDTRAHTEALIPLVTQLCADAGIAVADLGEFVVGVGPGPFTGLRVGIVTAHTLAALAGQPLHGVCSLDVIARQAVLTTPEDDALAGGFTSVIDARRKQVYWARHDAAGARVDGPFVTDPDALPDLPVTGPGAALTPRPVVGPAHLDAGVLATDWAQLPDAGIEPLYLRKPDATEPTRRKSTLLPTSLSPRRKRTSRLGRLKGEAP